MSRPKALDLFCKAGGASMGLYQAGFDVTGVDIQPQKHYPAFHDNEYVAHFTFLLGDALDVPLDGYDLIWASPPCQFGSVETPVEYRSRHPNLIPAIRARLKSTSTPYIIENVENVRKHLINPIMLCGSMFGLTFWRHRYFEIGNSDTWMLTPVCNHSNIPVLISGTTKRKNKAGVVERKEPLVAERAIAAEINWMIGIELDEAIPPAYSKFLAEQLLKDIR